MDSPVGTRHSPISYLQLMEANLVAVSAVFVSLRAVIFVNIPRGMHSMAPQAGHWLMGPALKLPSQDRDHGFITLHFISSAHMVLT